MNKKLLAIGTLAAALLAYQARALVTLPYTFQAGQPIEAAKVNANDQALRDGINQHIVAANPHNTTLAQVVASGSSVGANSINFNLKDAVSFVVEKLASDPTCNSGARGRLIWNTNDSLFKICNGTSFVSIAGTGVNTLASVLTAGNSAGSTNLNMNGQQVLTARVENRTSDPACSGAGHLIYRTDTSEFRICDGTNFSTLGGAQGLASVLGVSNSAGSTNIDFNLNQGVKMVLEKLSSDPSGTTARIYYNTTSNVPKFYNGSSWLSVGNTNTLAQTMALGNSVGSTDLNMNSRQLKNARTENLSSDPGTGNIGRLWFNTSSGILNVDDGSATRQVVSTDNTQTLTNKTISGSSNTLTNIPDSALGANVTLNNGAQTFSAKKTFSSAPQIGAIKTATGTTNGHTIPDGLADDTFVLAGAVQTLAGKTLQGPALSGNMDFNLYQAQEFRVENRGSDASPGNPGRIYFKTSTGELVYDDGSNIRALTASGSGSITPWTIDGNADTDDSVNFLGTTDSEDLVIKTDGNEVLRFTASGELRTTLAEGYAFIDSDGDLTSGTTAAPASDVTYDHASSGMAASDVQAAIDEEDAKVDAHIANTSNPHSVTKSQVGLGNVDNTSDATKNAAAVALTNKTINAASNTITNISDAEIKAAAGIAVNKLAAVTANRVLLSDASGFITPSSVTNTTLGYLDATSSIQTQLNGKMATGTVAIASGGTGQTSKTAAMDALSPTTTLGDIMYGGTGGTVTRLAGSTSASLAVLTQTGNGTTSAAPVWSTTAVLTNPMTTSGDIIYGGASGVATRLAKGTDGNYLTQVSGVPAWTSEPRCEYVVDTGNGHGSTNTKIRRYTNTRVNTGSCVTYADSSTAGGSWTINSGQDGVYAVFASDSKTSGATIIGISVNDSAMTTAIQSISYAQGRRSLQYSSAANIFAQVTWVGNLAAGDVVRMHDLGDANATDDTAVFSITKISN